jgi:uracil-DNA glycosylase
MDYEKFAPLLGDWAPKFKAFIESTDFDDIYTFLKSEARDGKIICPKSSDTFRAFTECPYKDLKCIFILQDPYPWVKWNWATREAIMVADGLAMSCSNTGELQPSLELFYEGIEDDLGKKVMRVPDLKYLANQGVLLLNTSLTVEKDKPSSHTKIHLWDKFIKYLIEEVINFYNSGLIYVGFGQSAQDTGKMVLPFLHWGFDVEHPAFAARQERMWKHDKIFTKINRILKDSNNEQIIWNYAEIQEPREDPYGEIQGTSGVRGKVRAKGY